MKLDRLLWHQVDLLVEADIDINDPRLRTWLERPARLVPRAGGVTVSVAVGCFSHRLGGVLCRTSEIAIGYLDAHIRDHEARANEVEGTATAQYHRDCAMRYRALACVIRARATRLWPEEADAC